MYINYPSIPADAFALQILHAYLAVIVIILELVTLCVVGRELWQNINDFRRAHIPYAPGVAVECALRWYDHISVPYYAEQLVWTLLVLVTTAMTFFVPVGDQIALCLAILLVLPIHIRLSI